MAKPKLQPLGNRVLVKADEAEETTKGGLIIPATANDDKKPASGTVVMLGTGRTKSGKEVKFDVKEGDRVFFKKYSPEEVEVDGETYLLVDAEDILAVIN
jgi:chaperonin GroES